MIDWPVFAGDAFLIASLAALLSAPLAGVIAERPRSARVAYLTVALLAVFLALGLGVSWRGIAGGVRAAVSGALALAVSIALMIQLGRLARTAISDALSAALAGLMVAAAVTIGPFAAGPLLENLSPAQSRWLLTFNPLVTIASAAGIDLLHLDTIYRTSPLAHRGVALPAWTTACAVYAAVGLAANGVSRRYSWSRSL